MDHDHFFSSSSHLAWIPQINRHVCSKMCLKGEENGHFCCDFFFKKVFAFVLAFFFFALQSHRPLVDTFRQQWKATRDTKSN